MVIVISMNNHALITKRDAREQGLKHYFTGKPCSLGHISPRHLTGTCVECGKLATKRWAERNPGERTRRTREWQRKNPERARLKSLAWRRKKDGLPIPPYPVPACCENCQKPFKGTFHTHLDHCHKTGKFRGWLCSRCNRGLGYFDDCIEGLQRAVEYLKRSERESQP